MIERDEVLQFIKHFQNEGTIKTFTEGCCYWFAKILDERFNSLDCECESGIMYYEIDNHFATYIGGKLYDITGEIPLTEEWEWWYEFVIGADSLLVGRIIRDCIEKRN